MKRNREIRVITSGRFPVEEHCIPSLHYSQPGLHRSIRNGCHRHYESGEKNARDGDGSVAQRERQGIPRAADPEHPFSNENRIRDMADFQTKQEGLGGGFYGLMPKQLADLDAIPIHRSPGGVVAAALCLTRQRATNMEHVRVMKGDFPAAFTGVQFPPLHGSVPASVSLEIDGSVVSDFLTALEDGRVTPQEARAIAELPANREMLEHRVDLGYVPPPLPTTGTLAEMIRMAGARDPLDRLWCWINPHNFFDYADIVQHRKAYARLLSEIETSKARMAGAVLSRIPGTPPKAAHSMSGYVSRSSRGLGVGRLQTRRASTWSSSRTTGNPSWRP